MRLNRKQKILRNLLVCLLLALATYAALGFPPYTVEAMCRQVQRDYLLPELEPVYVLKEKHEYSGDWVYRHFTFLIARCRDTYVSFLYDRHLLQNERQYAREVAIGEGALCMARAGTMYVAGDFKDVCSAAAVVRADNGTRYRDFTLQGEKLGEEGFGFDVTGGKGESALFFWQEGDEEEMSLAEIANYWYRRYDSSGNGYGLLHASLPVTVTLYDERGEVMNTLSLSVETYDLHSWY